MKAMILAAGLGTRLLPLTKTQPKALINVKGKALLEHVLLRLIDFGVTEVIINLHHFPQQIQDFLKRNNNFGIHIELSFEKKLLDTGGGLKKASHFFSEEHPFLLHNVDIISDINLHKMREQHLSSGSLVTLAVQKRETSRYLLFDQKNSLCGWRSVKEKKVDMRKAPSGQTTDYGFCGIHFLSPSIFDFMEDEGAFSIITFYLHLISLGAKIQAYSADHYSWYDLGKKEVLAKFQKE